MADGWGWAGSVADFLALTQGEWAATMRAFLPVSLGMNPSEMQESAWADEFMITHQALQLCMQADASASEWSVTFEFELPLEGGRRPDVVVLAGSTICVLEFKSASVPSMGAVDQVRAYARDLEDYHAGSQAHGRVVPILVLAGTSALHIDNEEVIISGADEVSDYLLAASTNGSIDLHSWLRAPYRPLPTLVAAARRIFRDEPLPHVKKAEAVGIPETLALIARLTREAEAKNERLLILVTGVPGSGKTLVGLRLVYEQSGVESKGTFLSGNGPLVLVLQDALKSKVFVRDLHAYIKTYGIQDRTPFEPIVVFDEAQRAWDAAYMREKKNVSLSEPELLVAASRKIDGWSALVGLVGDGQEIHSGEEGGMKQWREALSSQSDADRWAVHCAPRLAGDFEGLDVQTHEELDLTVPLRSRRAGELHEWVSLLLEGGLEMARHLALRMDREVYPIYVTRDLQAARTYARQRYPGEPDKRYGLLASSHSKLVQRYGIDNHFLTLRKNGILAPWFNAEPDDPRSCCQLIQPMTEFQCQGLELDLPILCWGEDFRWVSSSWELHPIRRRYRQDDPGQLLTNAYRVLLTRGRDGLVIFVPPDTLLDATEEVLIKAGVEPLASAAERLSIPNSRAGRASFPAKQ
jgi:DUF2075 family protein